MSELVTVQHGMMLKRGPVQAKVNAKALNVKVVGKASSRYCSIAK